MRSLTPPRGYRLILTQVEGGRPAATVDCHICAYTDAPAVPVDADVVALSAVILAAVERWTAHDCYVDINISNVEPYPQEHPAGHPERRRRWET